MGGGPAVSPISLWIYIITYAYYLSLICRHSLMHSRQKRWLQRVVAVIAAAQT